MNRRFVAGNRGSFSLEGALVLSALLMVLSLLMFSFTALYQKSVLQKSAAFAAQQGAEVWVDSRKIIENGDFKGDEKRDSMYYRLFSDKSGELTENINTAKGLKDLCQEAAKAPRQDLWNKKTAEVRRGIYQELGKGLLIPEHTTIGVKFENRLIERKLEVVLAQDIKIPLGFLFRFFSGKSTISLEGRAAAAVVEPAEYIRNIDLGIECAQRIGEAVDLDWLQSKVREGKKTE